MKNRFLSVRCHLEDRAEVFITTERRGTLNIAFAVREQAGCGKPCVVSTLERIQNSMHTIRIHLEDRPTALAACYGGAVETSSGIDDQISVRRFAVGPAMRIKSQLQPP
jgi:hypothetical protein